MAHLPPPGADTPPPGLLLQVSVLSLFLLRSVVVYAMNAAIVAAGMPQSRLADPRIESPCSCSRSACYSCYSHVCALLWTGAGGVPRASVVGVLLLHCGSRRTQVGARTRTLILTRP